MGFGDGVRFLLIEEVQGGVVLGAIMDSLGSESRGIALSKITPSSEAKRCYSTYEVSIIL